MTVLAELELGNGSTIGLRRAAVQDVSSIVRLLADDELGAARDGADDDEALQLYLRAFKAIDSDPAHLLVVAIAANTVVGTMQLCCFLPGLSRRGALREQIEAVRVAANHRAAGLGTAMITWAIEEARRRECALVQLTTDKSRKNAHRFYYKLGFVASHEGLKLTL
ncbi:GNAT family N-acetyltransferase [Arthrobacter sp. H14]|uniref:GNAT family N-acetyltransferase n=1 Tax=Arthrobacter sp. H14 TaxID=1312959 RepID=UPI000684F6B3|nr:GNAT family N-acetyltransferase [Arthrobacter sp. H14]